MAIEINKIFLNISYELEISHSKEAYWFTND